MTKTKTNYQDNRGINEDLFQKSSKASPCLTLPDIKEQELVDFREWWGWGWDGGGGGVGWRISPMISLTSLSGPHVCCATEIFNHSDKVSAGCNVYAIPQQDNGTLIASE